MTTSLLRRLALSGLVLAGLTTCFSASAHAAAQPDAANSAPVAAQTANGDPGNGVHSLGFVRGAAGTSPTHMAALSAASLPASVDLSSNAPPVGNQGSVNSCTAWATGYYLRGWYAKRDGYYSAGGNPANGSYAPMYTYAQIVHGQNNPTTFGDNLNIQQSQGIDTRADYTQGDNDFTSQPTTGERANAAHAKLYSYEIVEGSGGFLGGPLQNYIETKMAGGDPIALSIPIYPEFDHVSSTTNYYVGSPLPGETSRGGHAIAAFKYDQYGVWIENSWGTSYGKNGWAELSWDFVNRYAMEAVSIVPLSPLERFYGTTQTHWVTRNANAVTSAYHYESTLGLLLSGPQSGAVPLYGCLVSGSNDHFVSTSSTCEGRVVLGVDGYIYSSAPLFVSMVQVYRCYRAVSGHGDHFVSTDSHCEGYTTDYSLGYLRT
jgi:hypothetical protein